MNIDQMTQKHFDSLLDDVGRAIQGVFPDAGFVLVMFGRGGYRGTVTNTVGGVAESIFILRDAADKIEMDRIRNN